MSAKRVLSLGQCSADHSSISWLLRERFGAEMVVAQTPREAWEELQRQDYDLVLVNRLLNGGGSGLDFITRLKSDGAVAQVPVMLVSDREDAQQQAVANGALPGFGKREIGSPRVPQLIREALAAETALTSKAS